MTEIALETRTSLQRIIGTWEREPLFVTLTGVHLYGFPSPDSDWDLRGAYVLPLREVIGLHKPQETWCRISEVDGLEVDLVLHDIGKYLSLLSLGNASLLEELYSPLVLQNEETAAILRQLAQGCIVRRLFYHYNGFAQSQVQKLWAQEPRRAKTLLYIYRALLTGIHALETGEMESNLPRLNERFQLDFLPRLIAAKVTELAPLPEEDWGFHRHQISRLFRQLRQAWQHSTLPLRATGLEALESYLIETRLSHAQLG